MLIGCLVIVSIILILRFINLILYIKQKEEIVNQLTISMTLRIKLGLIPFFIINFVFCGILWIGTFNIFLIFIATLIYVISLITTYLFLLIEETPNIIFLIDKFFKTKKIIYLICAISHFIYFFDIIGALIIFEYLSSRKIELKKILKGYIVKE